MPDMDATDDNKVKFECDNHIAQQFAEKYFNVFIKQFYDLMTNNKKDARGHKFDRLNVVKMGDFDWSKILNVNRLDAFVKEEFNGFMLDFGNQFADLVQRLAEKWNQNRKGENRKLLLQWLDKSKAVKIVKLSEPKQVTDKAFRDWLKQSAEEFAPKTHLEVMKDTLSGVAKKVLSKGNASMEPLKTVLSVIEGLRGGENEIVYSSSLEKSDPAMSTAFARQTDDGSFYRNANKQLLVHLCNNLLSDVEKEKIGNIFLSINSLYTFQGEGRSRAFFRDRTDFYKKDAMKATLLHCLCHPSIDPLIGKPDRAEVNKWLQTLRGLDK